MTVVWLAIANHRQHSQNTWPRPRKNGITASPVPFIRSSTLEKSTLRDVVLFIIRTNLNIILSACCCPSSRRLCISPKAAIRSSQQQHQLLRGRLSIRLSNLIIMLIPTPRAYPAAAAAVDEGIRDAAADEWRGGVVGSSHHCVTPRRVYNNSVRPSEISYSPVVARQPPGQASQS